MANFKDLCRLGKDAQTRFTQAGKAVTGFSAAYDIGWGDKKQTVWLDVSGWGERYQKIAEYLTKGSQAVLEGDVGTREHEGNTYLTLNLTDVKLTGGKKDQGQAPAKQKAAVDDQFQDDDLPW